MTQENVAGEKVAVVTGASRGLGVAFARVLAEEGYRLALGARDTGAVEHLAGELGSDLLHPKMFAPRADFARQGSEGLKSLARITVPPGRNWICPGLHVCARGTSPTGTSYPSEGFQSLAGFAGGSAPLGHLGLRAPARADETLARQLGRPAAGRRAAAGAGEVAAAAAV